ncbi:alpha/beta fold hydrolase [Archangium minus]|uniref:Alpha/beta fold hydrolase n=1 Tax=Archangium minus TaxID=83450 RepID=A0ABY9X925_9BACT|nr:alpha/beta fold hydrolase [Archangium violaceum]WNG51902.1 alpha/beta fold hydrolase [Archangium minus]
MSGASRSRVTAHRRERVVDGRARSLLEVTSAGKTAPPTRLLIAVHGSNQTAASFRDFTGRTLDDWSGHGEPVVYPESWKRGLWNDARVSTKSRARHEGVDDIAFLRALVDDYRARGVEHVYALGFSNGGQLVIRALHEAPTLFDAAVLVGATLPAPGNLLPMREPAVRPVPMLLVHGTRDPIVPYAGGMASLFGFRPRGLMSSFDDSEKYWVERAGIRHEPRVVNLPRSDATRTTVVRRSFTQDGHAAVLAVTIEDGGHVFPNRHRPAFRLMGRTSADLDIARELVALHRASPE